MAGVSIGEHSELGEHPRGDFDTCTLPHSPLRIRYSRETIQQIRATALAGLLAIRRGGLEVGGVLFGTIQGNEVSIVEHRPLQIEYVKGPSYTLSPNDEENLDRLIAESASDPELSDMQPVGWYHSHTRSDLALSPDDIRIHERHFPQPEQVVLVIKPFQFEAAKVGIFARAAGLSLSGDAPCCQFEVTSVVQRGETIAEDSAFGNSQAFVVDSPVSPPLPYVPSEPEPPQLAGLQHKPSFSHKRLVGAAALIFCAAAGLLVANKWRRGDESPAMRLHVSAAGAQLTIAWDGSSSAVQQVRAASLTIQDGDNQIAPIPLDDESLRRGTLTYVRRTGEVVVRMRVAPANGPVTEEVARFIGPSPPGDSVPQTKNDDRDAELLRTRAELERLKNELTRIQPESQRSRAEAPEPKKDRTIAPAPGKTAKFTALMKPAARLPEVKLPESTPIVQLTKPSLSVALPPVSTPSSPVAPPVQQPAKPASGRAIWTGRLPKGGLLLLDGRRPSVGSLTGSFPQTPARIRVYCADLAQSGILVYTNTARTVAVEPPSAANGWNLTTYTVDPKRSRAVTVLEHPGQQNGWKPRLLIRGEEKNVSMLVIDWDEVTTSAGQ